MFYLPVASVVSTFYRSPLKKNVYQPKKHTGLEKVTSQIVSCVSVQVTLMFWDRGSIHIMLTVPLKHVDLVP